MTLRTFKPTPEFQLRTFRVLCMFDRHDKDLGRIELPVRASGDRDARNQALQQMREQGHRAACVLRSEPAE